MKFIYWILGLFKKQKTSRSISNKLNDIDYSVKIPKFFKIDNDRVKGIKYIQDQDYGSAMNPRLIVIHFTCSYSLNSTIEWFQKNAVDIHLLISKAGELVQMVPFNKKAAHAGKSSWNGYYGLNNYAIGIEVINIGPLVKKINGKLYDCYGKLWTGEVIERNVLGYKYWEPFTIEQIETLTKICADICVKYKIPVENICGHHECSPGRKSDPGGSMLSMDEFRENIKRLIQKD